MGVTHLEQLRNFLKKNNGKKFSKTSLRDELKQNYNSMEINLDYLIRVEKVVIEIQEETKKLIQWKNVRIQKKKSKKA